MKIADTVRLATTNLRQNKRRSVTVVVTMAVIFGLVMGVGFFVGGMHNLLMKSAIGQTGKLYLNVGYTAQGGTGGKKIDTLDETVPGLEKLVEQYGGKKVGTVKVYDSVELGQVTAVSRDLAEALAIEPLRAVPDGKIGAIKAEGREVDLPEQFVVVGKFRGSSRLDMTVGGFSPSNFFVGGIWNFGAPEYYLVDGDLTEKYMLEEQQRSLKESEKYLKELPAAQESDWIDLGYKKSPFVSIVAKFASYEQAQKFYDAVYADGIKGVPETVICNGVSYSLTTGDFVGHTMDVARTMDYTINTIITPVVVVLAVVALLVAVSTFAHLVESDTATILLYRARGASLGQVYLIYFIYLLELCLLAVVMSILVGLVLALGMSVISVLAGFGGAVQEFFGLAKAPFLLLIGVDVTFWRAVGLILLVAPVVLLMTSWRFSSRHIAKRLKEDM